MRGNEDGRRRGKETCGTHSGPVLHVEEGSQKVQSRQVLQFIDSLSMPSLAIFIGSDFSGVPNIEQTKANTGFSQTHRKDGQRRLHH